MNRIPEFFDGPVWASPAAQRTWEPRLRAAAQAWQELEVATVANGLRSSALVTIPWEDFPAYQKAAQEARLEVTVLGPTVASASYSGGPATSGRPAVRAAVHRRSLGELPSLWRAAWADGDDAIGELLGFPKCCRDFFRTAWAEAGGRDTTGYMATLDGPATANILLRWLGVRFVPWLPCSADCEDTRYFSDAVFSLGCELGFGQALRWAKEALGWKMTWSASHGVGEVVTPALKFRFSTVWTPGLQVRHRAGSSLGPVDAPEPTVWEDNGFTTEAAMLSAHATVVAAARSSGYQGGAVLDLGCGDGRLLNWLGHVFDGVVGHGIDLDSGRIERGRRRYPRLNLSVENIADFGHPDGSRWPLVLLMPGRLIELGARGKELAALLPLIADRVVVYAYGDWLAETDLEELARRVGLRAGVTCCGPGVEAAPIYLRG